MSLGLPPVSVGLKAIAPYLQRAEELVTREPVIAYWCAYYAAQVGISIKAQDTGSRNLLLNLLNALERLKKEIGPNDAVDSEPASAAFVENFALRVFKMADDEDRAGKASKSTAKKFLAAANFFEVLRVFPKSDISESTESKIKYSKWKAADIAKAFREGRQPTPGPAGSQLESELTLPPIPSSEPSTSFVPSTSPERYPRPASREASPPGPSTSTTTSPASSRSSRRQSPPPQISSADIARANSIPIRSLGEGKHDDEALSPGRWSTTATPGFDLARTPSLEDGESASAGPVRIAGGSTESVNNWHERVVDPVTRAEAGAGGRSKLRNAWVSAEMEGTGSDEELTRDPVLNGDGSPRRVRFTPTGEPIIPIAASPPPHPQIPTSSSPPRTRKTRTSPTTSDFPLGFVPTTPPTRSPPSSATAPSFTAPPPPPPAAESSERAESPSAPTFISPVSPLPPPSAPYIIAPPVPSASTIPFVHPAAYAPPAPASITPPPSIEPIRVPVRPAETRTARTVELTPSILAKAQKHCRFAISALDYEDAEQAKKELRAALEILGG